MHTHTHAHTHTNNIFMGLSLHHWGYFVYVFFSPRRNDPKKQINTFFPRTQSRDSPAHLLIFMCFLFPWYLRSPKNTNLYSETFRWPQPPVFFQKYCRTNGGRTAVQMGGVLPYKWEAYCRVSLSSKLRSQESIAVQMGGVLPYKLEVYCRTFRTSCRGWGFRNIAHNTFAMEVAIFSGSLMGSLAKLSCVTRQERVRKFLGQPSAERNCPRKHFKSIRKMVLKTRKRLAFPTLPETLPIYFRLLGRDGWWPGRVDKSLMC